MRIPRDHTDTIRAFHQEGVRFIVVDFDEAGPGDLFLWVEPKAENIRRVYAASERMNVVHHHFGAEELARKGGRWTIHGLPRGREPETAVQIVIEGTLDEFEEAHAESKASLLGRYAVRRVRIPPETKEAVDAG